MLRKLLAVLALALVSACSSGGGETPALPSGPDLLKKSAEAMKTVKTAAFAITTEGKPQVPVRRAQGRLTAAGDADGTIQIDILGSLQELNFFLVGDSVHFKGPTGGFQQMTRKDLAQIYDPSLILDPSKGLASLLTSATDARVEAEEGEAYRVAATFSGQVLATLVPGITTGVNGKLWIDRATSRLTRLELPLQGGKVLVSLSDYDVPVQITPPPAG